jgi:hypothetical protein
MIDLRRRYALLLDGVTQHLNNLVHLAEGAQVVRVPAGALVGAAVVWVNAHDQPWYFRFTDTRRWHAAAFEVGLHCLVSFTVSG